MRIDIRSFDTLFFRDGKPFSQGEEVWANGLFPPPPSVLYGALRTAYFSRNLGDLPAAGTDQDPSAELSIQSMFLRKAGKVYVPCPYDIVARKGSDDLGMLALQDFSEVASSLALPYALCPPAGFAPAIPLGGKYYVPLEEFVTYLEQAKLPGQVCKMDNFVVREPKIGLTRSAQTGSAEEGKLYRVELFRPKSDVGILLDWRAPAGAKFSLPAEGFFNMGGEAKSVWYTSSPKEINIPQPALDGNLFKVVLCTPALFEQGWLPAGIDPETLRGKWRGHHVEVLSAALDRSTHLGGFDMKKNRPKAMRRAVPAGAVYYLKTESEDLAAVLKAFHGQCLSEFDLDRQGFGLAYVGKVNSIDQSAKNA